jgi:hypothetical protein
MLNILIQLLIKDYMDILITLSNSVDLKDNYLLEQYGKELTMTATSKYYQKVQGQILFLGSNNMQMDQPFSC